ncbi:MAG: hypothetical protein K0B37_18410, partial [Bacteroidales bacterium]|nr:hypothetical protein [Bacteroidales bacterium]
MSDSHEENMDSLQPADDGLDPLSQPKNEVPAIDQSTTLLSGMYQDWFLDYASYVILERAVPEVRD